MQQNLNVPKELLKRYSSSKRMKELFALAICIKMWHESSVAWDINDKTLRYRLHIGKTKATRLLEDARNNSELFMFYNEETIKVNSFRTRDEKINRKGKRYRSDDCFKFQIKKDYKLSEVYNLINEFLASDPINAQERKDCLICKCKKGCGANSDTLTLKQLSRNTRMSKSSTHLIMKRLQAKNIIRKRPSVIYSVAYLEHPEDVTPTLLRAGRKSFSYTRNGMGYIIVPCSYSIIDRRWSERFQHVIYNYRSKVTTQSSYSAFSTIPQFNE